MRKKASKYYLYKNRMVSIEGENVVCTLESFLLNNQEGLDPGEIVELILLKPGEVFLINNMASSIVKRIK